MPRRTHPRRYARKHRRVTRDELKRRIRLHERIAAEMDRRARRRAER